MQLSLMRQLFLKLMQFSHHSHHKKLDQGLLSRVLEVHY